jgi:uncharacterized protein YeeX (DUF496 family)
VVNSICPSKKEQNNIYMTNLNKRTKSELIDIISTMQLEIASQEKKVEVLETQLTGSKEFNYELRTRHNILQKNFDMLMSEKNDYEIQVASYINNEAELNRQIESLSNKLKSGDRIFWVTFIGFTLSLIANALNYF